MKNILRHLSQVIKKLVNIIPRGEINILGRFIPKSVVFGVAGAIMCYISVAGFVSYVTPWWLGAGDAPRHIDYALSVYNLDIPQFSDRLTYAKFNELANGTYRNQLAAVHPPLFYILHAPLVGPLLEAGRWEAAIAVGRAFNLVLGSIVIILLAILGWLISKRHKKELSIATAALGALLYHFALLNQNYANDVLLMMFCSAAFILSYKLINKGPNKKYLILLALCTVLGMATKATYIVVMGISLLSVVYAFYSENSSKSVMRRLLKGLIASSLIVTLVVSAIGWFYYTQNYQISGNWTSAAPETFGSATRPYKSLSTVLTSSGLWQNFYGNFIAIKEISIFMVAFSVAGLLSIFDRAIISRRTVMKYKDIIAFSVISMIGTVGILMTQISHAVGYGGFYFRYFLPLIAPMTLLLSSGLLAFRKTRGQLLPFFVVLSAIGTSAGVFRNSAMRARIEGLESANSVIEKSALAFRSNGIPDYLLFAFLAIFMLGVGTLSLALFRASSSNTKLQ